MNSLYRKAADGAQDQGYIQPPYTPPTAELEAVGKPAEDEDGVLIIPSLGDEGYPEDYVNYCIARRQSYKRIHGKLPEWKWEGEGSC